MDVEFCALTRSNNVNRRIAALLLAGTSLLVTFALVEFAARRAFLLPFNPSANGWWEVAWLKRGADYSSDRARLSIDKFDAVLGWTLKENLRDVPLLTSKVSSNSRGVRGVREYPLAKGQGTRVVVIGDSYTFGEGVNDDQTYSAGLERLLDHGEVLNLAVHGYGTDQQLLRLERDGVTYRPDIVVLGYYEEDIIRNRLWFRDYAKPHFSVVNDRLVVDNWPIPSPEAYRARVHLRSLSYLNILMTRLRERPLAQENVVRSRLLLDEIFAQCRSIHATVIQLYVPTPDEVHANQSNPSHLFTDGCHAAGVVCVDPTPAMHAWLAPHEDWKQFFRTHYSPELHLVIAQELARAIGSRAPHP